MPNGGWYAAKAQRISSSSFKSHNSLTLWISRFGKWSQTLADRPRARQRRSHFAPVQSTPMRTERSPHLVPSSQYLTQLFSICQPRMRQTLSTQQNSSERDPPPSLKNDLQCSSCGYCYCKEVLEGGIIPSPPSEWDRNLFWEMIEWPITTSLPYIGDWGALEEECWRWRLKGAFLTNAFRILPTIH